MLETTVVGTNGRRRTRRLIFLPLSIGIHLVLIAAAIVAAVSDVTLPDNAPLQVTLYSSYREPPLPPPAPPPPLQNRERQPQPEPTTQPQQPVVPTDVPADIPDLPQPGDSSGSPQGQIEGQPGGDPNGVVGGIDGGVSTSEAQQIEPPTGPIHVGPGVTSPRIVYRVKPRYPPQLQKIRLQGYVLVQCTIDRTGAIRNLHIVSSSHPGFEPAAIEALRQWRFTPGLVNDRPVDTIFELKVNFTLH